MNLPMLSLLTFLPLIGAAVVALMPAKDEALKASLAKWGAMLISLVVLGLAGYMTANFSPATAAMQFEENRLWIEAFNVRYHMGVDGISVFFVLLTALLTPICLALSWESVTKRVPSYMAAFLALEGFVIGVFCALDFMLFYVLWEAMLVPMFLIIGIWGGENRVYAAVKFFLYTFIGSVLMLIAMMYLYFANGHSFDMQSMSLLHLPLETQKWLWLALFAAFAVKVPMWPFHTWLPDAHVQAPTAGSVILAGILLKMGAYGFLRFSMPMLPEASHLFTPLVVGLSVIAILYTAAVALAQTDVKKMIAYSSVSHMGFVTLGIFAATTESVQGALMQMINHGIVSAALFMLIGVIYDRLHTRDITRFGGIANVMPFYAAYFMLFTMAAVGLPGSNSFVGEFLVLLGSYKTQQVATVLAAFGVVLGAVYMLSLYKRMMMGEAVSDEVKALQPMNAREKWMFAPLAILVVLLGVMPKYVLGTTESSVHQLLTAYENRSDLAAAAAQTAATYTPTTIGEIVAATGGAGESAAKTASETTAAKPASGTTVVTFSETEKTQK